MSPGGRSAATLLDDAVTRALRRRPGAVIGLLDGDERLVRAGGDVAGDSLLEIGSVTKVFTATLLADAVVRGGATLDTPVRELLPAGTAVPSRGGVEITLEHLATHRSGLPRSPRGIGVVSGSVRTLRGRNPYAGFEESDLLASLAGTGLRRTPGTGRSSYSNAGFGLLGVALAHAAGTSYDALVTDRVCRPLGLADTVTPDTAAPGHRTRWAPGHRGGGRPAEDWVLHGIAGGGALRSTVGDLLDFLAVQLDPSGSPLEEAVRLTQEVRVPHPRSGVCLGWMHLGHEPATWWHNGGTGGFRSMVAFVPGRRRAVVALTDSTRGVDLLGLRLLRDLERS